MLAFDDRFVIRFHGLRANSLKSEDAKPPVYGMSSYDSGVADTADCAFHALSIGLPPVEKYRT